MAAILMVLQIAKAIAIIPQVSEVTKMIPQAATIGCDDSMHCKNVNISESTIS